MGTLTTSPGLSSSGTSMNCIKGPNSVLHSASCSSLRLLMVLRDTLSGSSPNCFTSASTASRPRIDTYDLRPIEERRAAELALLACTGCTASEESAMVGTQAKRGCWRAQVALPAKNPPWSVRKPSEAMDYNVLCDAGTFLKTENQKLVGENWQIDKLS